MAKLWLFYHLWLATAFPGVKLPAVHSFRCLCRHDEHEPCLVLQPLLLAVHYCSVAAL